MRTRDGGEGRRRGDPGNGRASGAPSGARAFCEHSDVRVAIEDHAAPSAAGPARPRRARSRSSDRAWLACLLLAPLVAFVAPALVGHPILLGDDLTQNEPLRILVGSALRHGHLPLFDPYLWSGAPLLAGWNAGAAYPLTWLFALLPATAAWTAGLVVTWWVAGLSFYWLLRAFRLVSVAAGLGALSFAFGGAFLAQIVHFGLVAGMSWVPLQVLAVHRLTEEERARAPSRWSAVLAVALGLTVLAGEPRAIDDALIVVGCFAAWRVARLGRRGLVPLAWVVTGLALGAGLGAVQWLPGLEAVGHSQRGGTSSALFASGSLPDRWLGLLLVPDLLGGSGSFRQPAFLGSYSLTEVSGYLGPLPVVGAFALLGGLRRGRRLPDWVVWHLVGFLGVVLALGVNTPVGHLLAAVPFYGAQRLQSRNVVVLDVALAVLLAYAVDHLLVGRAWRRDRREARRTVALALTASALLAAPVAVVAAGGNRVLGALRVGSPAPGAAAALVPGAVPFALLGILAGLLVVVARGRPRPRIEVLATGLVAASLLAYALLVVVAVPPSSPTGAQGATAATRRRSAPAARGASKAPPAAPVRPVASLGLGGRFAVYDPDLLEGAQLNVLGTPDGNVVTRTPSVLGYGSIVGARYAAATGSHGVTGRGQDVFSPRAAANGILDELDTRALLTLPSYLVTPASGGGPAPGRGAGRRRVGAGGRATWYFGGPLVLRAVAVPPAGSGSGARLRLGLIGAGGATRWLAAPRRLGKRSARWTLGAGALAYGIRVRAARPATLGPPHLETASGAVLVADGQLAGAIAPPRWRYAGRDGAFAVFADRFARPPLALRPLPGRQLGPAVVRRLAGPPTAPTSAAVDSLHGALVVRAVDALPGWRARWRPSGGVRSRTLAVRRRGLVQAVAVPPGRGVLVFSYQAPGAAAGGLAGLASLVVLCVLVLQPARRRRALVTRRVEGARASAGR